MTRAFKQQMNFIQKYIPPEQGLKPSNAQPSIYGSEIQKYIPPEQGLKLNKLEAKGKNVELIQKYIPPEQGLKRCFFVPDKSRALHSEVHSTRTRIETGRCQSQQP